MRFTSLFGMEKGGATPLQLPENSFLQIVKCACLTLPILAFALPTIRSAAHAAALAGRADFLISTNFGGKDA